MYYPKGSDFFRNSEEFVKACMSLPPNSIILAIEHDYGQIAIEFVPSRMFLSGTVYSYMNEEKEKSIQLDYKDIANENTSALILSSALYTYIAEAYRIASILERTLIQNR
jgi:hypothetical protein